jgi:hypothetical protein
MARPKKPLEPLIPLDKLKNVVAGLLAVPKDKIEKPEPKKPG